MYIDLEQNLGESMAFLSTIPYIRCNFIICKVRVSQKKIQFLLTFFSSWDQTDRLALKDKISHQKKNLKLWPMVNSSFCQMQIAWRQCGWQTTVLNRNQSPRFKPWTWTKKFFLPCSIICVGTAWGAIIWFPLDWAWLRTEMRSDQKWIKAREKF